MDEYINKKELLGWTLIPPPTSSGKIIPKSADDLPAISRQSIIDCEWRWCFNTKPEDDDRVEVLCYDDHGDTPYTYVSTGWRLGDYWIVNYDTCYDVVAWKPLTKPLSVEEVRRMLKI